MSDGAPAERTLTVLGCDGSYPGPGGAGSGYLLRVGDTTVLLDAGPGTFSNLQLFGDPGALDAVVLSHEHPDHWSDLESLAVWLLLRRDAAGSPRPAPLPVLAPPGLAARSYFGDAGLFDWREVGPGGAATLGSLALRFAGTDHGPTTLAVRIDGSSGDGSAASALAYTADTGPGWSVATLGTGIGTVLCEATYTAASEGGLRHLSGRQAGTMAREAGVGRLVLTHRWPTVSADELAAEAAAAFGRGVDQAAVGMVIEW